MSQDHLHLTPAAVAPGMATSDNDGAFYSLVILKVSS